MTIKYEIPNWSNTIKEIEIERETEKSIWVKGIRRLKRSDYSSVFNTFWEAAEYLLIRQRGKIDTAQRNLVNQQAAMQDLKDYIKKHKRINNT